MKSVNLEKIKKAHFIGIGGIGLSAIAKLMKEEGKEISGSDLSVSLITDNLKKTGIRIYIGQSKKNISEDLDLVIYTMAIKEKNPELKRAKELGIKTITYPKSLGLIFNNKFGVAVCGTHGKSTTTAMAGLLLEDAGFDPTIVVGSIVPRYNSNLRIGKSKFMAIEACEYERAFLNYYPKVIVLNNIELDHTDYYKNIEDYISAFEKFIWHLPENGIFIYNGDEKRVSGLKVQMSNQFQSSNVKNIYNSPNGVGLRRINKRKVVSFGLNKGNNVRAENIRFKNGETRYNVFCNNKGLGEFVLKVPGIFNVYNSLAAISLGVALNISSDIIKKSLKNYKGIWRRFEIKGKYRKALVVSDYAHHPTEVKETIKAAKQFYPQKRLFVVFQPHQHNRTKILYKEFLKSFDDTDIIVLSEIFDVVGREESRDQNISSLDLVNDMKKKLGNKIHPNPPLQKKGNIAVSPFEKGGQRGISRLNSENIFYTKDLEEARKLIDKKIKPNDILLVVGAGDIYKLADSLTK